MRSDQCDSWMNHSAASVLIQLQWKSDQHSLQNVSFTPQKKESHTSLAHLRVSKWLNLLFQVNYACSCVLLTVLLHEHCNVKSDWRWLQKGLWHVFLFLSAGAVEGHLRHVGILSFHLLLAAFSDHIHDQSETDKNEQHYADHLLKRQINSDRLKQVMCN